MSRVRSLGLAILVTYAVVGVASSQLMLCFHGDGRTQIELASVRCCNAEVPPSDPSCQAGFAHSETPSCPDDQCQDVSLSLVSPPLSSTATVLDLLVPQAETLASAPACPLHAVETGTAGGVPPFSDHPPESGPRDHLRTVILRL